MSVAEEREGNEKPEQQSVKLSEWIQHLEAQPERIRFLELKALLERLDPDAEWVRQLKGRIDRVLEPKVLGSDAASRLARLKRHLVFELFTQRGPFWEAIRDARARLGVEARTELPPPDLAHAFLAAEEEWPEEAAEYRERLVEDPRGARLQAREARGDPQDSRGGARSTGRTLGARARARGRPRRPLGLLRGGGAKGAGHSLGRGAHQGLPDAAARGQARPGRVRGQRGVL
jgi:hypothetical protein